MSTHYSQKSIRRTQSLIDFFLSPEPTVKDKYTIFSEVVVEYFPELAVIYDGNGGFFSLEYLRQHSDFPYSIKNPALSANDVAHILREESEYRQKRHFVNKVMAAVVDYEQVPISELNKRVAESASVPTKRSSVIDAQSTYKYRKNRSKGFISGVRNLDKLIDGFEYGTLNVVGGFSGHFKTTFLISLLYNSLYLGYNSLFITLEIPKELLYFRLISRHSYSSKFLTKNKPISFIDIYKSTLTDEQHKFLFEVVEPDFKKLPGKLIMLEQNDLADFTYGALDSYIRALPYQVDALFLDYAQLLATSKAGNRDPKDVGNFYIRELTRLAVGEEKLRRIVFLAAQTNREGLQRAEKVGGRYDLRALSELNQLEKDSSCVITVYTDDSLRASGEIKVSLIKNRFGDVTSTPVLTRVDPRFSVIGDEIEGYSDPISTEEAKNIFENMFD